LTPQSIAALEPEACTVSPWTIALTAIAPVLPRAYSRDTSLEQIALIDEYKPTGWRKVWVLRMPRSFITSRTCDAGRKNWIGDGDDRVFSQHYEIDAVVTNDDVVPITRAEQSQRISGVPVQISIENRVTPPERRWKSRVYIDGVIDDRQPLRCKEEPSDVPGLIAFRRINEEERDGMRCGDNGGVGTRWEKTVYGKKVGDRSYEFVVNCVVNCRLHGEYQGWTVELAFERKNLPQWTLMMGGARAFLDRTTMVIDHDDGTGHR
jgi:hypothetical protein